MFAGILGRIALSFAGTLIDSMISGFLRWLSDRRREAALTEHGRTEQELEQSKATVEVIAVNQTGQDAVDNMTEQELEKLLTES